MEPSKVDIALDWKEGDSLNISYGKLIEENASFKGENRNTGKIDERICQTTHYKLESIKRITDKSTKESPISGSLT